MIPTSLYTALEGLVNGRCYPIKLPERVEYPAITFFQVSGNRNNTHDGYDHTGENRWQISCWARTYKEAKELAEHVKDILKDHKGGLIYIIKTSQLVNEQDLYEPDTGIYHIPIDFTFLFEQKEG